MTNSYCRRVSRQMSTLPQLVLYVHAMAIYRHSYYQNRILSL
jgi:hypothetical protein